MQVDTSNWSGEGAFTQRLVEWLSNVEGLTLIRVEDAPASRSEADYNFISNEVFVAFETGVRFEPVRRLGIFPGSKRVAFQKLDVPGLEARLTADPSMGAPDYSDEGMLQYLRTERIVPPYQTRGYKLVELVRVYDASGSRPADPPEGLKGA
jgi:hypothetical protein